MQITQDAEADLGRGTRVTLHLKEDAIDMAMASKLNSLIKQYSQYIQFPIRLWNSKQESEEVSTPHELAPCSLFMQLSLGSMLIPLAGVGVLQPTAAVLPAQPSGP